MNENDNYESRMSDFDIISTLQQRIAKKQIQTFLLNPPRPKPLLIHIK